MATLDLRVRPGAREDRLEWDPWRERWTVSCRAPALDGRANREVLRLMAEWLEVPGPALRWERAGRAREKRLVVDGLEGPTLLDRLRRIARASRTP